MSSKLQEKLAAFRSNQQNLQSKAVEDANKRKATADRARRAARAKTKAASSAPVVKPMGVREKQQLGKRLKAVLDHLRSNRGSHTADDIAAATHEDVRNDSQLAAAVANNAKIDCTADGTYMYKPLYEIPDQKELLKVLSAAGERGLRQDDVDDSYDGIIADITKLQNSRRVYAIHHHDLRTTVLYARDPKLDSDAPFSSALAAEWRKLVVPPEDDQLKRALSRAGFTPSMRTKEFKRAVLPKRERKRRQQKVRIDTATNVHMPELFSGAAPMGIDT